MKTKVLLLIFSFLVAVHFAQAQDTVTGIVTDVSTGEGLIGATLMVDGTSNGAISDVDGSYVLNNVNVGDVITASYIGYDSQSATYTGESPINFVLGEDETTLEQVIVTGYSKERKKDLTGAVAVVNTSAATQESNTNVVESLQGRVAGVDIATTGAPGGRENTILLRGPGSINAANGPLIIVNGVRYTRGLENLDQSTIKSIQVLKDASSAAIYGVDGANGVIIIELKEGYEGETSINFSANTGVQFIATEADLLNSVEWGEVWWQALKNDGFIPSHAQYGNNPQSPSFPSTLDGGVDTYPGTYAANTNWQDVLFRPAQTSRASLNLTTAGKNSNTMVGAGYAKQDGILEYTDFERFNVYANNTIKFFNEFAELKTSLDGTYYNEVRNPTGENFQIAQLQHPLIPVYANNNQFAGFPQNGLGNKFNPLHNLYRNRDNQINHYRVNGQINLGIQPVKDLWINGVVNVEFNHDRTKQYFKAYEEGILQDPIDRYTAIRITDIMRTLYTTANYNKEIKNHRFGLLAGMETIQFNGDPLFAGATNFTLQDRDFVSPGTAVENEDLSGVPTIWRRLSYFGKVNYNYKDKYLASATLRRDGSSRFISSGAVETFPGFSLGWRPTEEDFFPESNVFDDIKIRFGWGAQGNDNVPVAYPAYNIFVSDINYSGYDFTGTNSLATGLLQTQRGNNIIQWERQEQANLGVDLSLFDYLVDISIDLYDRQTERLLVQVPPSAQSGEGAAPFLNIGTMQNRGLEIAASYNDDFFKDKLQTAFSYNFTLNRNKLKEAAATGDAFFGNGTRIVEGLAVPHFYGYVVDGYFDTQEEIDAHASYGSDLGGNDAKKLGSFKYRDGDGNGVVDANDRQVIGSPFPDFSMGLNSNFKYNNFDLTFFVDGVFNREIFNALRPQLDFPTGNVTNFSTRTLDSWSPSNLDASAPRLSTVDNNSVFSSYFLEDGSFVRLKTLSLGYSLPENVATKIKAKNVRFYVQGENLLNSSNLSGMDLEVNLYSALNYGVDNGDLYPNTKVVNAGLNIEF